MDSILSELNFPPNINLNLSSASILGTSFVNNIDNNEKNNAFLSDASSIVFDENEFNTSLNKQTNLWFANMYIQISAFIVCLIVASDSTVLQFVLEDRE